MCMVVNPAFTPKRGVRVSRPSELHLGGGGEDEIPHPISTEIRPSVRPNSEACPGS